jgi:hypothetical protein
LSQINPLHVITFIYLKISFDLVWPGELSQFVEVKFLAGTTTFLLAPRSRLSATHFSLLANAAVSAGVEKTIT